ncbi:hypothetical protein I6F33_34525 [Bradyrhizobium sp. BRP20]|uniref:hypothetical protein n=1 Tax=unclassified Bradyrhizobium TaxID=2631580 RepID=UPI001CD4600F|nr:MULTISPECIES: hypothetical protein [unclassified Bradyrhizobium]MCA1438032.1 hypothetical protein [Bradyrhizobium sp. BRP20]MCA1552092.1 hypothetical protein [Bradyrhizobium sp. BRP19]
MRVVVPALLLALWGANAVAQDWGNMAVISSTLGNNTNRLCIGDHARSSLSMSAVTVASSRIEISPATV